MQATLNLAHTSPLTSEHARQLDGLLETLSPEEAIWISGYLAGFVRRVQPANADSAGPAAGTPITIVYGSETGHAAALAERAGELARRKGLTATVVDTADFRPQDLKSVKRLLVVTSTHGEGSPPDTAADFYEFLHSRKAPRLEGVKFAVLGLGDSTYEHFCQTGKDIDKRLQELGGERIHARADCDVDYEGEAGAWIEAVLGFFSKEDGPSAPRLSVVQGTGAGAGASASPHAPAAVAYDAKNPFPAAVLESIVLNGRGSDKETRHIELSLDGSGLAYEPGDSLGVVPQNDPEMVEELIQALKLDGEERVPAGTAEVPLREALSRHYEITALTPRFLELYGNVAQAEKLRALTAAENRSELMAYVAGRQVIDVVTEFPVQGLGGKALAEMLRRLQPRLYSLASSPAAYPDEAHLTVSVVRYESHGRGRKGVASTYLAERCGLDETVPVYVERNKNFRLPADGSVPIIMVGAGTGVAPFRAFLQHRQAAGASGKNWLIFGERRFRTDFLYQVEWQRFLKDGVLSRMDVAFSRDQERKVYVQHRLLEKGRAVYDWLEEGAHVYVCGDANGMAPDIHAALVEILQREGRMSREQAEDRLKGLQRDRRYQRDVY